MQPANTSDQWPELRYLIHERETQECLAQLMKFRRSWPIAKSC